MAIIKLRKAHPILESRERDEIRSLDSLVRHLKDEGFQTAPCDLKGVAHSLGIEVVHEPMDDEMSGFLEKRESGWVAGINSYHHPVRQRFTLAHELGHFVLHRRDSTRFDDHTFARRKSDRSAMEREADAFAASLLMPEVEVRRAVEQGTKNLNDLARLFEVSSLAMRYRLDNLGYKVG